MSLQEDAKRILPYVQAMAEGQTVQVRDRGSITWRDRVSATEWYCDEHEYRIKPERKWRPYTREEWERVDRVRHKRQQSVHVVLTVYEDLVCVNGYACTTFDDALEHFTHLDGSPLGVEVEE